MRMGPFNAQDTVAITTLGLEFATAVALGTAGGFWADKHWQTTPWGILAGVLLGFALGMYIVIKEARRLATQDKRKGS
ncbi:MAG: AtpZ/AtpI family protein [Elusimicrobiaceae bacterium]|nr:AtpZ/AtpI family protein [Elusimicrobiaceae bacterium]